MSPQLPNEPRRSPSFFPTSPYGVTSKLRGALTIVSIFLLGSSPSYAHVKFGINVLEEENFKSLHGAKIALITNQTGVDQDGVSTVDVLHQAPGLKLKCILSPEHGFRGMASHGDLVADSTDTKTGLPIFSLYGATTRPTANMLDGVNTIVFDIQDIGTRFYTYITTMGMALEVASQRKILFVVLDRPNPIRGDLLEGDILDADIKRMTGYYQIPVRHGLTVGEIARWMNETNHFGVKLTVIPVHGWKRHMWYDETPYQFIPPSPNIRSMTEALLYPGIGGFEATNVSVGRGTSTPFELFGAPWINADGLCAYLREQNFPGVIFEPVRYTPSDDLYKNQECLGVKMRITNRADVRPVDIFVAAFFYLHNHHPEFVPNWEEVRVVTGSARLHEAIDTGKTYREYLADIQARLVVYLEQIKPYWLYPIK